MPVRGDRAALPRATRLSRPADLLRVDQADVIGRRESVVGHDDPTELVILALNLSRPALFVNAPSYALSRKEYPGTPFTSPVP